MLLSMMFFASTANEPHLPQIPTSMLIDVAWVAAGEWNKKPIDRMVFYVDIVDPGVDKMPGYKTMAVYVNEVPVLAISVNLNTGQVVEKNRCVYFHGPEIKKFTQTVQKYTGAKSIPTPALATQIGCDQLAPD